MGVNFTREGAKRIAATTVYVERMIKNGPPKTGKRPVFKPEGFLAILTKNDKEKYSWTAVKHKDNRHLIEEPDYGKGDCIAPLDPEEEHFGYAVESMYRSPYCCIGDIVWMRPSRENNFYVFDYAPGVKYCKVDPETDITARDELKLGKGTALVYWFKKEIEDTDPGNTDEDFVELRPDIRKPPEEGDPALEEIEQAEITVFNGFNSEIESDLWIQVEWSCGLWVVTGVDCEG